MLNGETIRLDGAIRMAPRDERRVRFEVADGVAVITIDRPERRNAIDLPTAEAMDAALDRTR